MSVGKVSICEAARLSGIGKGRLRNMLRVGELRGTISPHGRRFRVFLYSLLHDALKLPHEVALELTAAREWAPPIRGFSDELLERRRWGRNG